MTPGEIKQFHKEILPHLAKLRSFALRLTASPADAEDLVQDTLLRAMENAESYSPGTSAGAWLNTIMYRFFCSQCQRRRVRITYESRATRDESFQDLVMLSRTGSDWADPERVMRNQVSPDLLEALGKMIPIFSEAVILRDIRDFSYAEIAAKLEVPVGTVMSRIHRGRQLLLAALKISRGESWTPSMGAP
jgi:RNA polymerase sigma-70 factor (ECF subfamily)